MRLYHVTCPRNRKSIERHGLDPARATHGERAVWLVSGSLVPWALAHTAAKPGRGRVQDLVVYEVDVPRGQLKRFRRGIWRCYNVVRPGACRPSSDWTDAYPT